MGHYIDERADFGIIRYANCWEDADVLCAALEPSPGKRILSIASAGDNALALLAAGCEVVAADLSPAQLACVELRAAAFRELDYKDTLAFLGVTGSSERLVTYRMLANRLSAKARAYWDIANGARTARGNSLVGQPQLACESLDSSRQLHAARLAAASQPCSNFVPAKALVAQLDDLPLLVGEQSSHALQEFFA